MFCAQAFIGPHFVDIKVVGVFSIFCKLIYWNNSNYLVSFSLLYLYFASMKINIVIFLNHIDISVFNDIMQKKPKKINSLSIALKKKQNIKYKFVIL